MMPRVCLQFVIVVFPDHTHYFEVRLYLQTHNSEVVVHLKLFVYVAICLLLIFFKINFFKTIPSECQIVCIKIRPNILAVLICVQLQTVCKCYQQTILVGKKLKFHQF